jgi:hypothetical protein
MAEDPCNVSQVWTGLGVLGVLRRIITKMEDELFRAMDTRADSEQSQQDGGIRWMKLDSDG